MINRELNKLVHQRAKKAGKDFYHKRVGRCCPKRCAGACCRYIVSTMAHEGEYFRKVTEWVRNPVEITTLNGVSHIISPFHCPKITIDGKCSLHGKKEQPQICDMFPAVPEDAVYMYVKGVCGYRFVKTPTKKDTDERKTREG